MPTNLADVLLQYAVLLFSLCVHEAAHALVADRCGDPSARLLGRVTLNPLPHIDPVGTVLMPLVMMFTGFPYLFGWAKPVPFNPVNLRNIRRDPVLIAIAGPMSNMLVAIVTAIVLRVIVMVDAPESVSDFLSAPQYIIPLSLIMINLILMLFNLIPVPPLDGHHVLHYFLPPAGQRVLESIGPFGILIAIIAANTVLDTPLNFLKELVLGFVLGG
ncbi:MAG: site-2 protease family protein [Candidatus Hydrogenedentes bacterium]|nr:site-2 protease family protein [Candidatus Hydrogenedentota bacterium]